MKKLFISSLLVAFCVLVLAGGWSAQTGNGATEFGAKLSGYEETLQTLASPASGDFTATVSEDGNSIQFELSYADVQTNVLFAHIHLGARATTGGVMVFLCNNTATPPPPGPPQACPLHEGMVEGTVTAANVIGPMGQGVSPGEFEKVVAALRAGAAYANVHSARFPGGEIRGQIRVLDRK